MSKPLPVFCREWWFLRHQRQHSAHSLPPEGTSRPVRPLPGWTRRDHFPSSDLHPTSKAGKFSSNAFINSKIKERENKLTNPTLQHCLTMLLITNGNAMHKWWLGYRTENQNQTTVIIVNTYLINNCHICVTFGHSLSKRYLIEMLLCHSC